MRFVELVFACRPSIWVLLFWELMSFDPLILSSFFISPMSHIKVKLNDKTFSDVCPNKMLQSLHWLVMFWHIWYCLLSHCLELLLLWFCSYDLRLVLFRASSRGIVLSASRGIVLSARLPILLCFVQLYHHRTLVELSIYNCDKENWIITVPTL